MQTAEFRLEKLGEWLDDLQRAADDGSVVLVEGEKDVVALQELGFSGIIERCSQTFLQGLSENLARRFPDSKVVVLTDWDRKGEQLAGKLSNYLNGESVAIDLELRKRLRAIARGDINDVESLPSLSARLERLTANRDIII